MTVRLSSDTILQASLVAKVRRLKWLEKFASVNKTQAASDDGLPVSFVLDETELEHLGKAMGGNVTISKGVLHLEVKEIPSELPQWGDIISYNTITSTTKDVEKHVTEKVLPYYKKFYIERVRSVHFVPRYFKFNHTVDECIPEIFMDYHNEYLVQELQTWLHKAGHIYSSVKYCWYYNRAFTFEIKTSIPFTPNIDVKNKSEGQVDDEEAAVMVTKTEDDVILPIKRSVGGWLW